MQKQRTPGMPNSARGLLFIGVAVPTFKGTGCDYPMPVMIGIFSSLRVASSNQDSEDSPPPFDRFVLAE